MRLTCLSPMIAAALLAPALLFAAPTMTPVTESGKVQTPDFGEQWREVVWGDDGAAMVLVPGGTYRIGTEDSTLPDYLEREGPVVEVTVGSYYIDKYEVEITHYTAQARKIGFEPPRLGARDISQLKDQPARGISWNGARQYAISVRKDLPTEAEWEIAGRGAAMNLYPWGNEFAEGAVIGLGAVADPRHGGSTELDVSEFGVHDMAGNVSEWTKDGYVRDYYRKIEGMVNPWLDTNRESRTVRGGNYYLSTGGRMTVRHPQATNSGREELGFRTVFRLQKPPEPTPTPTPAPPTPTPTPSANVRIEQVRQTIAPLLADSDAVIPSEILGYVTDKSSVHVFNQTGRAIRLGVADIATGEIYSVHDRTVQKCSIATVAIPKEKLVALFAYPVDVEGASPVFIGQAFSASNPLLVMQPHTFGRVVTPEGETIESGTEVEATQVYPGQYHAQWNRFQVVNETGTPVEVFGGKAEADSGIAEAWRVLLEPGETALVTAAVGGPTRLAAKYIGATSEVTSELESFTLDGGVDHRIFVLGHDEKAERVRVFTAMLPRISIEGFAGSLPPGLRSAYLPGGQRR